VLQPDGTTLDVYVLDVGQGDSLLAVSPSGATLMVDGGPDGRRVLRELGEVLPRQRRIDVMVATHPQADHVTGLFSVLERYDVGTLLISPVHASRALGQRLIDLAEASGTRIVVAEPGMLIDLGAGVALDVLGPSIVDVDALNDSGVVLRLRHGDISILLTGDIEAGAELRLAREPWALQSDVLKVGHHGSATSTTDLLLRRVRPSLAVISAGVGNQFGHPHDEVLARLAAESDSTVVLRTDVDGRIRLRSDGVSLTYRSAR
jgi:competence protein ComEC